MTTTVRIMRHGSLRAVEGGPVRTPRPQRRQSTRAISDSKEHLLSCLISSLTLWSERATVTHDAVYWGGAGW
jgi:hypothetical protein